MEKQLELIQRLRIEINKLTNDRDLVKEKYNDLEMKIDEHFNCIQIMNANLDETNNVLNLLVENKACTLWLPLPITATYSLFIFLNIKAGTNFPWIMYLMGSIMYGTFVFSVGYLLTKVYYNKIEKYLVKKYPHIKKVYDKVKSLTNDRNLKEQKFMNMKKDRDNLKVTLNMLEEQLDRKREELYNVEEEYFNSLVGKTFINEDGKHHIVGIAHRGKTKIKIPDIKKNLGN